MWSALDGSGCRQSHYYFSSAGSCCRRRPYWFLSLHLQHCAPAGLSASAISANLVSRRIFLRRRHNMKRPTEAPWGASIDHTVWNTVLARRSFVSYRHRVMFCCPMVSDVRHMVGIVSNAHIQREYVAFCTVCGPEPVYTVRHNN